MIEVDADKKNEPLFQVFQVFNRLLRTSKLAIMLAESGKNPSQVSWLNLKICHKHDNVFDVVGSRLVSIQAGDITDGFPVKKNESCLR